MAIAFVQSTGKKTTSPGASSSIAFPGNATTDNYIFITSSTYPFDVPTPSDDQGNSYSNAGNQANGTAVASLNYAKIVNGGGSVITVTLTAAVSDYFAWSAQEFSGLATTSPLDKVATNTSASNSTTLTISAGSDNSQADVLAVVAFSVGLISGSAGISNSSGYTDRFIEDNANAHITGAGSDKIESSVVTSACTYNFNTAFYGSSAVIATFKAAAGAAQTDLLGRSGGPRRILRRRRVA